MYHKEGISVNTVIIKKKHKIILSYLNRVVDMKYYFNSLTWKFWKILVSIYYIYLLSHLAKCGLKESYMNIRKIGKLTSKLTSVDKIAIDFIIKDYN